MSLSASNVKVMENRMVGRPGNELTGDDNLHVDFVRRLLCIGF